jgi:hypothetical protein
LEDDEILVIPDFAATLDFKAISTLNCSVNRHGFLDNYVVVFRRRHVVLNDTTGEGCNINDCKLFQFLGETLEKGKKNDYVTHNANFDKLMRIIKRRML